MASRAGRKRKTGKREPSGRLQRPTTMEALNAANAKKAIAETSVVLMQPHRRGSDARECATALGRFWLNLKTDNRVTLNAGEEYAGLVRRWRAAWGAKDGTAPSEGAGTGEGPSEGTVRAWRKQIDKVEAALDRASCQIRFTVSKLVIDDRDLETRQERADALLGLRIVAIELQLLGPSHPFR